MKKVLVIAEKPSLMLDLKNAYMRHREEIPFDITFTTFAGHVMGLVFPEVYDAKFSKWRKEDLPIHPKKFIFKPTKDKLTMYKEVKELVKKGGFDIGFIATDPGREGELIAWAFLEEIGPSIPWKRLWWSDQTDAKLVAALKKPLDYDKKLTGLKEASFRRSYMDWLFGMNFSRAYTLATKSSVPLGRVMTPTLNIIVKRELEISNFVSKKYFEVQGEFTAETGDYAGLLQGEENGVVRFEDEEVGKAFISTIARTAVVQAVSAKKEEKQAPELHSLANLQNEANQVFGYTMQQTLAVAQSLYEKKLLSYPRTDSAHLTEEIAKDFANMLTPLTAIKELAASVQKVKADKGLLQQTAKNKRYVNDKKVSDHYAITPTGAIPDFARLSKDEINIYTLVAKRFLAIFLPPQVTEKTVILTNAQGRVFKTNGTRLLDAGYTVLYPSSKQDRLLPAVKKGDVVTVNAVELVERNTTPPARYNDKTLNEVMENIARLMEDDTYKDVMKEKKGIGTPATRGSIVEKLVQIKMIERKGRSFYPTTYGIDIIVGLKEANIAQPELTAMWEEKLMLMEQGLYAVSQFDQELREFVEKETNALLKLTQTISSNTREQKGKTSSGSIKTDKVIGKCPRCQSEVVEREKVFSCRKNQNGCDLSIGKSICGAKITATDVKAMLAGKETKEKTFTWKSGKKGQAKLKYTTKLEFVF